MNVRDKLLKENPWKLMLNLSIPAILGQFIVGLYWSNGRNRCNERSFCSITVYIN